MHTRPLTKKRNFIGGSGLSNRRLRSLAMTEAIDVCSIFETMDTAQEIALGMDLVSEVGASKAGPSSLIDTPKFPNTSIECVSILKFYRNARSTAPPLFK
jgi:hypothetical protein